MCIGVLQIWRSVFCSYFPWFPVAQGYIHVQGKASMLWCIYHALDLGKYSDTIVQFKMYLSVERGEKVLLLITFDLLLWRGGREVSERLCTHTWMQVGGCSFMSHLFPQVPEILSTSMILATYTLSVIVYRVYKYLISTSVHVYVHVHVSMHMFTSRQCPCGRFVWVSVVFC